MEKTEMWKEMILENEFIDEDDILEDILKYDFSEIFSSYQYEYARVGFIGENFQRIYIHFVSVIKNPDNPKEYFVYGKSKVKNNICEFQGKIELEIARYNNQPLFVEKIERGFVIANYTFYENPNQSHAGCFKGSLISEFYFDKDGQIKYDDLMYGADGFSNNQFCGSWISYTTNDSKTCNWGDFRMPYSQGLDGAVAMFMPNPAYNDYGWKNYNDEREEYYRTKKMDKWWK